MGILDDAMETNKLQAKNSAMALEAQLRTADEARTANLIAMLSVMTEFSDPSHTDRIERRDELERQIWKRLEL